MVKTAVILAAGLGSRLEGRTKEAPKGFLEIEGKSLIGMSVDKLIQSGIEEIFIGTGYLNEIYNKFSKKYNCVECIKNEIYASTGSMYTLFNMRSRINSDFLLLESDLLYSKAALNTLQTDSKNDIILASGETGSGDEVYIETDKNKMLVNMSKNKNDLTGIYGELVGISSVSNDNYNLMCNYFEKKQPEKIKMDYEYAMTGISDDSGFYVRLVSDLIWCEIDDEDHLHRAVTKIYPELKNE